MTAFSIEIKPCELRGSLTVPLSKSLLHRSQICAYLAGNPSLADLGDKETSVDIRATGDCLRRLFDPAEGQEEMILDCKESGSTLRFLVPLAAALGKNARFIGEGRLPLRPLDEYAGLFCGRGITLCFPKDGRFLPLLLSGKLTAGTYRLPGNVSSQYISGLLMALALLQEASEIELTTALESEHYVELTVSVMEAFGVRVERTATGYRIPGGQTYRREEVYHAEPDFSQAAFWLVASYLGHELNIDSLPTISAQGDAAILSILPALDRRRIASREGIADLPDFVIDASQIPDLIPVLSVAAAATPGVTRVINAGRLRIKECDRLKATREMLTEFDVSVDEEETSLRIYGKDTADRRFSSCRINGFNDHRMVMAAAIAATKADGPVVITDAHAVRKSYPDFFREFVRIGGSAHELNVGD